MHCHLVAVEVRVIRGTDERVNPDRFAFDQLWLEGLDRQSMQRRRAVEQHRMSAGDFIKYVPDFRCLALDHFLRAAHGVHVAEVFQSPNDERLEQNERHFLGQTALMKFEFGPDNDH